MWPEISRLSIRRLLFPLFYNLWKVNIGFKYCKIIYFNNFYIPRVWFDEIYDRRNKSRARKNICRRSSLIRDLLDVFLSSLAVFFFVSEKPE